MLHSILDFSFIDLSFFVYDFGSVVFEYLNAYSVVGLVGTGIFMYGERDDLSGLGFVEIGVFIGLDGFTFFADFGVAHAI